MSKYIIYDFETTGLDVLKDRAVEVAALLIENEKIKDSFTTIINCGKESTPDALRVHGISLKETQKGMESQKAFESLCDFMNGHYIVAHNGNNYDHFMLKAELHRHGLDIPDCKLIDSMTLAQKSGLGLSSFSLENLCKHFKIKNSSAHRALGDTKALLEVFEILKRKNSSLDEIHKLSREKKLNDIFPHFDGFTLLLDALEHGKNLEIEYENQKGEVKRRWIKPDNTELNWGSMCPMIKAECKTDKIEKAFRLDGFRTIFCIE
jgi:DNA polymerase III epsilon subunit-like protein